MNFGANANTVIKLDLALMIRLLEWAREEAKGDVPIHFLAENLISMGQGGQHTLSMIDYRSIIPASGPQKMHGSETAAKKEDGPWRLDGVRMVERGFWTYDLIRADGMMQHSVGECRSRAEAMRRGKAAATAENVEWKKHNPEMDWQEAYAKRSNRTWNVEKASEAETAADKWWDSLTRAEKKTYIQAHPRSKYAKLASAPETILGQHGWIKRGKRTFHHPKSRRKIYLKPSDTHKHHVIVTHPGGYVSEKLTDSDRVLSRVGKRMARPAGAGIGAVLHEGQGSLHRVLGVEHGKPLPLGKLAKLAKSDHPLAGRARLVLNLKRAKKRGGAEIYEAQRSAR